MNLTICTVMDSQLERCERAIGELANVAPSPRVITELRREFGASVAGRLLEVAALQPNARRKFGPGTWWVSERSLQQATPWQVAAVKADWLADWQVLDLCCGCGGDTMQFAARGPVTAVDLDRVVVAFAKANVRKIAAPESSQFVCQDATEIAVPRDCAIHIDPDRRALGGRASDPNRYQPNWTQLEGMVAKASASVVKLAPAARIHPRPTQSHRCWISLAGRVREQSWIGGEAVERNGFQPGSVSAIKLRADGSSAQFAPIADGGFAPADALEPDELLIDPDAAIRAAGLTNAFATEFGLGTLGGPSGFLTGAIRNLDQFRDLAVVGRVLWHGSADDRKLRGELRRRDVVPVVVKVRGSNHDPAQLSRRYRKCGQQPVTLWLGRSPAGAYAAITEPAD